MSSCEAVLRRETRNELIFMKTLEPNIKRALLLDEFKTMRCIRYTVKEKM